MQLFNTSTIISVLTTRKGEGFGEEGLSKNLTSKGKGLIRERSITERWQNREEGLNNILTFIVSSSLQSAY